ncbi:hypothetical protein EMPS_10395 [Entomortierella parvispora]|uniref:SH3 domain-containing protein n=1 Tax=Entomortierella parvispora TaxID=205924 RepID=A0A9P3HK16_9FUNG|nr:hypothetical protein EMPS_10395 [Entomortierella parvispora]
MIPSPNQNQHRPRLAGSTSNGSSNSNGSLPNIPTQAVANNFYNNIHQPSARSPLSQETTPFGFFRHKNLSTSALPSTQNISSSSSNLVYAPVTNAYSTRTFSPSASHTDLSETSGSPYQRSAEVAKATVTQSPVLPPLPPLAKVSASASPKVNGRPPSFQYVAQYYAWWDYIARDHDELSFRKGDILLVSREFDDLWCLGSVMKHDKRTSARHGFFPLQYCSLENHCYIPPTRVAVRSTGVPGTEPGGRLSIVLPFNANAQDEMTLRPGNQVRAIHYFDDGWVLGEQIDHSGVVLSVGVFPTVVAKPITAAIVEALTAASASVGGPGSGNSTSTHNGNSGSGSVTSSPSKPRHANIGSPLVSAQDIGLVKTPRQREDSSSQNTSNFNTLYSQQNSSSHLLQHHPNNGSISSLNSSASTIKPPGSPTSSAYGSSSQSYRASPSVAPGRSPLAGHEALRLGANPNRVSVQSTSSFSNSSRTALTNMGTVTEEQVIQALQERPAQDSVLQQYLSQGGNPNIVDGNGNSLLHLAIVAHSQASVVFLLSAPDIRLDYGSPISPLYTAVRFRSWKAAQQLLIQGADPNVHDERGMSVLHIVLMFMTKGETLAEEVVHLLCENKADVNCVANDKKTIPLSMAVDRELWAEAEILMAYGANPYLIWGRDRRQSSGYGQNDGTLSNGTLPTGYYDDPLWEAVNDDKVNLVRLLLKFYYAPTSFSAASSSPSPSPSSTQSSQSFFGPQHNFAHHSSASSYSANNGSTGNVNIPNLPHGSSVPMPFAGAGGHGTPASIPSPCSAQSSPGSGALNGYMGPRTGSTDSQSMGPPMTATSVASPKLNAIQGGSGHVGSFTNASANANMIGGANPIYIVTPKVLLQALTLAKDLNHTECLQVLSRPEVTLKEGTLFGTGSYGYNQIPLLQGNGGHYHGGHGYGHGSGGSGVGGHISGKEHRNLIQKLTSLFK